jgi:hypothetical protein
MNSKEFEERLRDIVHTNTSEMLDNPDKYGIYPTTKFYNSIEKDVHQLILDLIGKDEKDSGYYGDYEVAFVNGRNELRKELRNIVTGGKK